MSNSKPGCYSAIRLLQYNTLTTVQYALIFCTLSCPHMVKWRNGGILNLHILYKHRGTKRLVSVNICSVEGNSADIFVSKVSPGILVVKRK